MFFQVFQGRFLSSVVRTIIGALCTCVGSEGGMGPGTVAFTSCKHLDDCVSCDRCGLEWKIMVWGIGGG